MTSLVIVESPAKAKTISRFLGPKYVVEASYGHVRDLPEKADEIPDAIKGESWARFGVNLQTFEPYYVIPESKKRQIEKLKKALAKADELLLATDEDREGESISWHLLQVLQPEKRKIPVRRIVFHEVTKEAILRAIEEGRDVNRALVGAQEGRRVLDRLFGYSLSPVLWRKVQSGLSAGRVQSVAVRLVVEREEERRKFRSSVYWDLSAKFDAAQTGGFNATLVKLNDQRLATGKDFDAATGKLKSKTAVQLDERAAAELRERVWGTTPWVVSRVEDSPGVQRPAPPFTTSTLQQEANRKLGFGAERTMRLAQGLYEGVDLGDGERVGLITYMRTDSLTLSDRALREAQQEIKRMFGAEFAQGPRQYRTKTRNAQEAHEAIRPTDLGRRPQDVAQYLNPDQLKLYELVWKRTLASQMPDAKVLRTAVEITARTPKGDAVFATSGKRILFAGYLRAYVEGSDDPAAELGDQETILPALKQGQEIARSGSPKLVAVDAQRHETTPPARYTEASLVKALEEQGIGRPSTYATIISTIQARGYVFQPQRQKMLIPTFTAMAVTDLMRKHFGEYVDIGFTARMEDELDNIAARESTNGDDLPWRDFVRAFFHGNGKDSNEGLEPRIARIKDQIEFPSIALGNDPKTGTPVSVRVGRYGPYVSRGEGSDAQMASIPADAAPADFTVEQAVRLIEAKAEGPRAIGTDPESGMTVYAAHGRFGAYVQLGEVSDTKGAPKPKRASLPKGMSENDVDLDTALHLLSLPRVLGKHPETGEDIVANNGRFGPYVQRGREFRSLKGDDNPYTVTLERALELLAQPKVGRGAAQSKSVLRELGTNAEGTALRVMAGRYGAYVTDGKTNATLPKDSDPADVTIEQATQLLAARAKSGKSPARKGAKKAAPKKPAAKKSAKKAAKKAKE